MLLAQASHSAVLATYDFDGGSLTATTEWFAASADIDTYTFDNLVLNGTVVPEPSSMLLLGPGSLALILRRRRA